MKTEKSRRNEDRREGDAGFEAKPNVHHCSRFESRSLEWSDGVPDLQEASMSMSHEQLEHPGDCTKPIGRWVLGACAKVNRESPEHADHVGLLVSDPKIGAPLVVSLGNDRQLTTSTVQQLEPGPNDSLYVHTRNSVYWIRRLSRLGIAE